MNTNVDKELAKGQRRISAAKPVLPATTKAPATKALDEAAKEIKACKATIDQATQNLGERYWQMAKAMQRARSLFGEGHSGDRAFGEWFQAQGFGIDTAWASRIRKLATVSEAKFRKAWTESGTVKGSLRILFPRKAPKKGAQRQRTWTAARQQFAPPVVRKVVARQVKLQGLPSTEAELRAFVATVVAECLPAPEEAPKVTLAAVRTKRAA